MRKMTVCPRQNQQCPRQLPTDEQSSTWLGPQAALAQLTGASFSLSKLPWHITMTTSLKAQ
jgi:hypothetical protein